MICKKCGAKNRDTREECFNCGCLLVASHKFTSETREEKYEDYPDDTKDFHEDDPIQNDSYFLSSKENDVKDNADNNNDDNLNLFDVNNIVVEPVVTAKSTKEPHIEEDKNISIQSQTSTFQSETIANNIYEPEIVQKIDNIK